MKISAAAILILCVVIDQKATVQGGLLDRFRGKDKAPDEASGGASGGFSGGLSGNLKLPGNILSECSVGGNVNGNIGASTSGGIQGGVNAGVNLPSCDCIRRFDSQGSVGGGGSAGFGGFGVSGGASFGGSLAMPGVNCVETDNPPEEKPDEEQDPSEEQESSEDEDSPEEESSEEEEEEEEVDVTTLPLCANLRQQDIQGSLGGTDTPNKAAPGNRNKDNIFEKISVIIPGVNCYESEPPEEESEELTEAPEEAPEKNSYCYRLNIDRDTIISARNNFLTVSEVKNADAPAEFYQTMDMGNALQFFKAYISVDKKPIYDSKPEKKMTNVCDDSYPEGSIEAIIWKIINLEVMEGKGCPVKKGDDYTFPQWLNRTELTFNEPLDYGNYSLEVDFDTPQGAWALTLIFYFVVDENSECTGEESFDESTEAPEELEESEEESEQCYIVDMDIQVVKIPIFMDVLNKPMDKDNAFKINGAAVRVDDEIIYDSRSEEEMTNACEDSYPEGSFQANIWHMFNLGILNGKGCPVEQGSIDTFPSTLDDIQLKINKRLPPGDYNVNLDLSAPNGAWAGATYFHFMLDGPSECREEEEPQEPMKPVEDESNSYCYKVDITRSSIYVPKNKFLKAPVNNADVTAEFYQTMDMDNALQFSRADIALGYKTIYDSKPEQKMKNACNNSYPEGSFEANIWKIFNLSIMNGQECPLEKGDDHTFVWLLKKTELNFNDPLKYGNYRVHMDIDTPEGEWALGLYYDFLIDENSMCNPPMSLNK